MILPVTGIASATLPVPSPSLLFAFHSVNGRLSLQVADSRALAVKLNVRTALV